MSPQIPIFIVSLQRDIARRAAISQFLDNQGLEYEFIDAIDGAKLSDDYFNSFPSPHGRPSGKNALACSLSHQSVYKKIIDEGIEWALILEDDVIIDDRLAPLIQELSLSKAQQQLKTDYVYILGGQEGIRTQDTISLSFFNRQTFGSTCFRKLIYKPSKIARTCCYLIHKNTSNKIIDEFQKGFFVADAWSLLHKKQTITGYYLTDIIRHPEVTLANSHIESERKTYKENTLPPKKSKNRGKISNAILHILLVIRRTFRSLKY
nr:glycosyltransferase family 25 protein [uncultured Moellerella sp.]